MRYAILLSLSLAACLSSEPTDQRQEAIDPTASSGSRVEMRVAIVTYTGGDGGSITYRGDYYFHDTLLDHRCELLNDGVNWTCYPASDLTADGTYPGNATARFAPGYPFSTEAKVFSDSACTRRVAALYDPTGRISTAKMLIRATGEPRVYEVGREVISSTYYYSDRYNACRAYRFPSDFSLSFRTFEFGPSISGLPAYSRVDAYEVAH
jgi:hypothetical protein